MAFQLTESAQIAAQKTGKRPNMVLEIDGVAPFFSAITLRRIVVVGLPEAFIGGDWLIGGNIVTNDEDSLIALEQGTTTQITQELDQFSGRGASISSISVTLIDKDEELTRLITPGQVVSEMLARSCRLKLGFEETSFPDDYITVFRGLIDEITAGSGFVTLRLAHPQQKARSEILPKVDTELQSSITNVQTSLTLTGVGSLITGPASVDGVPDNSFRSYVRINDEIIQFTARSGNTLSPLTRGTLTSAASAHQAGDSVTSFYRLTGNVLDLALKLMLSKTNAPGWRYAEELSVSSFVGFGGLVTRANTIFFAGIDLADRFGVTAGDRYFVTGATNAQNNVSGIIASVEKFDQGSLIVCVPDTGAHVFEPSTSAEIAFRSRYATLPVGLGLRPDEVDIDQHEYLKAQFLSAFQVDLYIKDSISNVKEFIEKELYQPAACYSLPRKGRISVGYHIAPAPGTTIKQIDFSNVLNANELKIKRSTNKNFFNSVVYRFEESALEDKFLRGLITLNTDSQNRIPLGNKTVTFESKGLRESLNAQNLAASASTRRLNKYKFAAEWVENVQVPLGFGFEIEIGDVVLLDLGSLKLSDSQTGSRDGNTRFFEVENKTLNLKTGVITLSLIDSGFALQNRFGFISPSSLIAPNATATAFDVSEFNGTRFGVNEYLKWIGLIGARVIVRRPNFSQSSETTLQSVNGQRLTVSPALSFTPNANDILELAPYASQPSEIKARFVFLSDGNNPFPDSGAPYLMI